MNIKTLASGSSGNCFTVSDSQTTILIECGIPYKSIQKGCDFNLAHVAGCLLSHEHGDHSHAAKDLIRAGINVHMSAGTAAALGISGYRVKTVTALKPFTVGTFKVMAFDVEHDAAQPVGYLLKSTVTGESLLFITDSYYVRQRFKGVSIIAIECNYIAEDLNTETTPPELYKRLVKSHMSAENCVKFLQAQDLSKCKRIYLTHISCSRGNAEKMVKMVRRATGKEVDVCGRES